ncbi:methyltransferase-like protein 22 [Trichomycterus rosablanca]|uniref:methyltransferase-like protein 22 n=1 Tax=Trichomycterus rosablanca TaxID=2290929 RepID=UPI002F353CAB
MEESLQKSPEEGNKTQVMDRVTFRSDTVLSDVHLLLPNVRHLMTRLNSVGQPVFVSKFSILSNEEKKKEHSPPKQQSNSILDEDGDLDVVRRPTDTAHTHETIHPVILSQAEGAISDDEEEDGVDAENVIKIEHTMATPLEDVGKQIWRGALLLSDFLLSNPSMFRDATVLELGSGTGLTSIVLARMAKTVYCTDIGDDLLSMCKRNVQLNGCCNETSEECGVKVRQLDWTADDFPTDSEFGWSEEEIADLYDNTTFIIAADVCYDDDLTDALMRTVYRIASNLRHPSTAYFCLEKRLNFTLRHMDVSCEAYDHFRQCLEQLKNLSDGKMTFTVSPVQCSFPQFFQYERVNQLELWKVSASAL